MLLCGYQWKYFHENVGYFNLAVLQFTSTVDKRKEEGSIVLCQRDIFIFPTLTAPKLRVQQIHFVGSSRSTQRAIGKNDFGLMISHASKNS